MNRISVVIPTFNRTDMLQETLRLLTKQTAAPTDVVVVDNGTRRTVVSQDATYPFELRYFRICAGAGASQARNFGAAVAKGRYIAFLDDDDFWEPDYLERLSRIVTTSDGQTPAMIVARVDHLDKDDRHFYRFAGDDKRLEACFYFNPGYIGSCVTVERSTFLELGGFDVAFKTGEDKELAIRYMVNGCSILYDAALVAINRVHERSLSQHIDHVKTAHLLLQKYAARVDFKIRVKTLREAYKKTRKKRYLAHRALLKIILVLISLRSGRQ